jgi:hypothetical protein
MEATAESVVSLKSQVVKCGLNLSSPTSVSEGSVNSSIEQNGDACHQSLNGWKSVSHFLVDSDNLANLQLPLGASSRIKVLMCHDLFVNRYGGNDYNSNWL